MIEIKQPETVKEKLEFGMSMMLFLAYEAVFRRKTTENSPEITFAVVLQDRTNQFQANEHH